MLQVTTFILYKLQRASELEGGSADLLLQLAKQGGFPKLCNVLQHVEGSAAELAFTLLLEMASTKEVQQALADKGELRHIVQVMMLSVLTLEAFIGCVCCLFLDERLHQLLFSVPYNCNSPLFQCQLHTKGY